MEEMYAVISNGKRVMRVYNDKAKAEKGKLELLRQIEIERESSGSLSTFVKLWNLTVEKIR